jgi:Tol biopolymer transport system component
MTLHVPRLPFSFDPLIAEAKRRMRWRRLLLAVVVLGIAAAAMAAAAFTLQSGSRSPASVPPVARSAPPADAIVFASAASDSLDARSEIAYVPATGGTVISLLGAPKKTMAAAEPHWSPDGSRIAFVRSPRGHLTRYAGDGDIYVMNANGTHLLRLTRGLDASSPAWSPDGSRIAFIEGQGQALAVMRANGSGEHVIASTRGYYEAPTWSPDGRAIAYQSGPDWSRTAIFTIRPNGTGERRLTPLSSASPGFPAWSPDGSRIAYSTGSQVWVMNSGGTGAHRLTNCHGSCVSDFAPA